MHIAAKAGSVPAVEILIKYGGVIDVTAEGLYGARPLHLAAQQGHHKVRLGSSSSSSGGGGG